MCPCIRQGQWQGEGACCNSSSSREAVRKKNDRRDLARRALVSRPMLLLREERTPVHPS